MQSRMRKPSILSVLDDRQTDGNGGSSGNKTLLSSSVYFLVTDDLLRGAGKREVSVLSLANHLRMLLWTS